MRTATPTGEEPSDEILHHETSLGAENSECCIHLFTAGGGERGGGVHISVSVLRIGRVSHVTEVGGTNLKINQGRAT